MHHHRPDPLTVIADEVRRRGLPEHGGLNAEIWHRSQSHARYAANGTQRPETLPAAEAIVTLPEQVWQEVTTEFDKRVINLAAQESPSRLSAPSSTRAAGPDR
ncbi:hypothetical protein GII33_22800 (plasmid) [Gordonia pseudamarae]|jgi:hypothetical protein|uniref:hypothetical protein n=1 Tax=Gordonia pseudamarae TaxID=2831662 RepID=UPI001AF0BA78|nr:hypothetical protein [Gordonia pseudamarae]QHN28925.1 hypothetical protein GII33_22800 [Gordonia pseudamarae]